MFADPTLDSLSIRPINFLKPSGPASVYPRRARRARPIAMALAGAFAVAFAAAALTLSPAAGGAGAHTMRPVRGEFRLGPGNAQPPGIVVPLGMDAAMSPVRGEFRLGTGNAQPPGIVRGR